MKKSKVISRTLCYKGFKFDSNSNTAQSVYYRVHNLGIDLKRSALACGICGHAYYKVRINPHKPGTYTAAYEPNWGEHQNSCPYLPEEQSTITQTNIHKTVRSLSIEETPVIFDFNSANYDNNEDIAKEYNNKYTEETMYPIRKIKTSCTATKDKYIVKLAGFEQLCSLIENNPDLFLDEFIYNKTLANNMVLQINRTSITAQQLLRNYDYVSKKGVLYPILGKVYSIDWLKKEASIFIGPKLIKLRLIGRLFEAAQKWDKVFFLGTYQGYDNNYVFDINPLHYRLFKPIPFAYNSKLNSFNKLLVDFCTFLNSKNIGSWINSLANKKERISDPKTYTHSEFSDFHVKCGDIKIICSLSQNPEKLHHHDFCLDLLRKSLKSQYQNCYEVFVDLLPSLENENINNINDVLLKIGKQIC